MTILDHVMWWSGVAAWVVLALMGALYLSAVAIDYVLDVLKLKRDFFAFVVDRVRARKGEQYGG